MSVRAHAGTVRFVCGDAVAMPIGAVGGAVAEAIGDALGSGGGTLEQPPPMLEHPETKMGGGSIEETNMGGGGGCIEGQKWGGENHETEESLAIIDLAEAAREMGKYDTYMGKFGSCGAKLGRACFVFVLDMWFSRNRQVWHVKE